METASSDELNTTGFIISTVSSTDPLLSPGAKGRAADEFYFSEFTDYDRVKFRREMLETTSENIKEQYDTLCKMVSNGSVCVVGPKETLEGIDGLELADL